VVWFSLQFCLRQNVSHFKENSARHYHKCTLVFMYSTGYSGHILINVNFSSRISNNLQISNCLKIRTLGDELFLVDTQTDIQTYRQIEVMKLIGGFRNFSKAPKNYHFICFSVRSSFRLSLCDPVAAPGPSDRYSPFNYMGVKFSNTEITFRKLYVL